MLKNISPLLSPEILYLLAQMGHGDDLAIVDANFPAASHHHKVIYCSGANTSDLLKAIVDLLPIDDFESAPLRVMKQVGNDQLPEIAAELTRICQHIDPKTETAHGLSRQDFYSRTKQAYCVIACGEQRLYGNCLIRKGVIKPSNNET